MNVCRILESDQLLAEHSHRYSIIHLLCIVAVLHVAFSNMFWQKYVCRKKNCPQAGFKLSTLACEARTLPVSYWEVLIGLHMLLRLAAVDKN